MWLSLNPKWKWSLVSSCYPKTQTGSQVYVGLWESAFEIYWYQEIYFMTYKIINFNSKNACKNQFQYFKKNH